MKRLLVVLLLLLSPSVSSAQQSLVQAEVPDRVITGALGALNAAVTVSLSGRVGVGAFVATGTLSGTVIPEVTIDGSTWLATSVYNFAAGTAPVRATNVTLNTLFGIEIPSGTKQARLRVSVYSSGTSNATILATTDFGAAPLSAVVSGTVTTTPPANASTNVAQINGTTTDSNSGTKSAGTIRVVLATDQPQLTNKLLVTPDSIALPANQSVNVAQVAGTTTDTNSGTKSAGTIRVVLATDQPALTNKLLVTPDSVALPANQSTNVAQVAGTATDVDSGVKSAGTIRVVLATDQPALTNKLLVTPDALPANQSTNVAQVAGTATDVNSGVKSAGTMRVVLATDQPALTNKLLVTPDSVALPANQSVNVAQVAGTATSVNNGTVDAGTQRVTIASDSTGKVTVTPVAVSTSNNDGTCTSVAANTTVLASFATRKGAVIMAQCDPSACNTDTTFIKLAATATTADFPLAPGDKFVLQGSAVYTGIIDAIANSGTQKICVMEF